jgi:large subunit ribosomal protein L19
MKDIDKIKAIEKAHLKSDVPAFNVGDEVKVSTKVVEGDKTRSQMFEGTVIRRKGSGTGETFTVLKFIKGSQDTIEKIFPIHSPTVEKITVVKKGKVKTSRLYHLRSKKVVGE